MLNFLRKGSLKGSPFEIQRRICLPEGETSLKSLGRFCGVIATESILTRWTILQSEIPDLKDIQPRLIKPKHVTMVHAPEVDTILTNMSYQERTKGIKRSQTKRIASSVGSVLRVNGDVQHTVTPKAVRDVRAVNYPSGLRLYVALEHEDYKKKVRPHGPRQVDVQVSLGAERRSLENLVVAHTDDTLNDRYKTGIYFAEIPHEVADMKLDPKDPRDARQTLIDVLCRDADLALEAHRQHHLKNKHSEQGIFMVDPPYISHDF